MTAGGTKKRVGEQVLRSIVGLGRGEEGTDSQLCIASHPHLKDRRASSKYDEVYVHARWRHDTRNRVKELCFAH